MVLLHSHINVEGEDACDSVSIIVYVFIKKLPLHCYTAQSYNFHSLVYTFYS